MTPAILLNIGRLGAIGGIVAIGMQLVMRLPMLETGQTRIEQKQETSVLQHDMFSDSLGKYMDLSIKLQRASCLNGAETKEERLRCNE